MQDAGIEAELPEGLGGLLEAFASALADDVIRSTAEAGGAGPAPAWETLAGGLASAVVEVALMEVSGVQRSGPELDSQVSASPDVDLPSRSQIPEDSQASSLSRLGLAAAGSLDYPDAPPTTPLQQQPERSRGSFARRLKGGLARVFLPSPPPPTPMDGEHQRSGTPLDSQAELMEHLVHSLTAWAPCEEGPQGGAKMEALAEALSWDIMEQVLGAALL